LQEIFKGAKIGILSKHNFRAGFYLTDFNNFAGLKKELGVKG